MAGVAHTPGPLDVVDYGEPVELESAECQFSIQARGAVVAYVYRAEDAGLYAAAPELLAVAIKSHEPYEGLTEDDIRSLYGAEEADLAMALRAAIARATQAGESDA